MRCPACLRNSAWGSGRLSAHVPHHVAHHIVTSPHARIDAPRLALSIQIGRDMTTLVKGARSFGRCLSALAIFSLNTFGVYLISDISPALSHLPPASEDVGNDY